MRLGILAMLAVVAIGELTSRVRADVVINEILFAVDPLDPDPSAHYQWVELYNRGPAAVSLAGWRITGRDGGYGPTARGLPSVLFPPGSYLVMNVGTGPDELDFADQCGTCFTGDPAGTILFGIEVGDCGLYGPSGVMDFVTWSFGVPGHEYGLTHAEAVAEDAWSEGDFVATRAIRSSATAPRNHLAPGQSLGRNQNSDDFNLASDWNVFGGDAIQNTPCARNYSDLVFVTNLSEGGGGGVASSGSWTILLYLNGDDATGKGIAGNAYHQINIIEAAGGSTNQVNFYCMVDAAGSKKAELSGGQITVEPGQIPGLPYRFRIVNEQNDTIVQATPDAGDTLPMAEQNMAAGATLTTFIQRGMSRYPASHYALVIFGHGGGWKGVSADTTSSTPMKKDQLFMGELRTALENAVGANNPLDLIVFNACLMGQMEVVWQVQPYSRYVVVSEQTAVLSLKPDSGEAFINKGWIDALQDHPGWSAKEAAEDCVAQFGASLKKMGVEDYTGACIDTSALPALKTAISTLAGGLHDGCNDYQTHMTIEDNVEELIRQSAVAARRFHDANYVDLHDLAKLLKQKVPRRWTPGIDTVIELSKPGGRVVTKAAIGSAYETTENRAIRVGANGLSIHFPLVRTGNDPTRPIKEKQSAASSKRDVGFFDDAYDYPSFSLAESATSLRAGYALNHDQLPVHIRDVETPANTRPGTEEFPLKAESNIRFPIETQWDEFLQRFYHPVSDPKIVSGTSNFADAIEPSKSDPWDSKDEITIYVGGSVTFSGAGSSDADMKKMSSPSNPKHWMWDFDAAQNGCTECKAPWDVPNTTDPAVTATDDMDSDQAFDKPPLDDEKEATGVEVTHEFPAEGTYTVTLNVWDDNHTFDFHSTTPQARYVHIQSDRHQAIVHVIPKRGSNCDGGGGGPGHSVAWNIQGYNSTDVAYQCVEDFRALQSGVVTGVCFGGAYDCSTAPSDSFTIRYYADQSGVPGPLLAQFSQAAATFNVVRLLTNLRIAGVVDEYEYHGTHPAVPIAAGAGYWVEIVNSHPGCNWYWEHAHGSNNLSLQHAFPASGYSLADLVTADRLVSFDGPVGTGPSSGCLPPPPANDECIQAVSLQAGLPTVADNSFATLSPFDPRPSCHGSFDKIAPAGVWYSFVATHTSAELDTCGTVGSANDSTLAVYSGTCGSLLQIGCSEDECAYLSRVCVNDLIVGETYYVLLAAWNDDARGVYSLLLNMPCAPREGACCFSSGSCIVQLPAACFTQGGLYLGEDTSCSAVVSAIRHGTTDDPLPIPDSNPAGVTSSIVIDEPNFPPGYVLYVDVWIPDHTYIGDLRVELEHAGVNVSLWDRNCGPNNELDATFTDDGDVLVCATPMSGFLTPDEPLSPFSGTGISGTWTLTVIDEAGADTGSLWSWGITPRVFTAACPQPEACCYIDGTCVMTTAFACIASGGAPKGTGEACTVNVCPAPAIGCCIPAAGCMMLTDAACAIRGGTAGGATCLVAPCAIQCLKGDTNCDTVVNNFDIDGFVAGLLNLGSVVSPPEYLGGQACWDIRSCWGDTNQDDAFNNFDIDGFVFCVLNLGCP